jgi:stalled ribosome alternative rescue factor ArfA
MKKNSSELRLTYQTWIMKLSNKKQIKTNYKAQLLINLLFGDEIEKKIKHKNSSQLRLTLQTFNLSHETRITS